MVCKWPETLPGGAEIESRCLAMNTKHLPPHLTRYTDLIGQRLGALFAAGDYLAAFEAKPVDGADDEEHNQRELKDGDFPDDIQYRDGIPGSENQTKRWIGIDGAQSAEPEEVDNHQSAVDQGYHID